MSGKASPIQEAIWIGQGLARAGEALQKDGCSLTSAGRMGALIAEIDYAGQKLSDLKRSLTQGEKT